MLFHSLKFLGFFAVYVALLPLFRGNGRLIFSLLASYIFYASWNPYYLPVLLGLTVYAWLFAWGGPRSNAAVIISVAVGLAPLAVFKYSAFFISLIHDLTGAGPDAVRQMALPLGLSFITFTAIAYVVDVQRGKRKSERSFWNVALYIAFFPHLIAGPIMRAGELIPQFARLAATWRELRPALLLFAVGAVKKVGIADQLAPDVDAIFSAKVPLDAGHALLALYGFAVQIYADFSGYTDMALALAAFLGISFPLNFNRPYAAVSIRDFWRRWHMTLSRWLRDYLYIPLGGSRGGDARLVMAVLVTMGLGGLWHGAGWTFILWGLFHGTLVAVEHLGERRGWSLPLPPWGRRLVVFHLVALAWVFFRAPSAGRAVEIITALAKPGGMDAFAAAPAVPLLIVAALGLHRFDTVEGVRSLAARLPAAVTVVGAVMTLVICAALAMENPSAFIYFDF
jgi:D-alanyl-lipoteichoic acid acyltransferase DltB (MBOAT superfamily)